jgi:hypothetical protein
MEQIAYSMDVRPLLARNTETGEVLPTYGTDMAGNLIYVRQGHRGVLDSRHQLLQFIDASIRHPWECGAEEVLSRIRTQIDAAPDKLRQELLGVYPDYRVPQISGVTHLDVQDGRFDDEEIIAVLGVLEMPGVEEALFEQFVEVLQGIGVERIPAIPCFTEAFHEGGNCTAGQPVETTRHGWMRDGRVIIKSGVVLPDATYQGENK